MRRATISTGEKHREEINNLRVAFQTRNQQDFSSHRLPLLFEPVAPQPRGVIPIPFQAGRARRCGRTGARRPPRPSPIGRPGPGSSGRERGGERGLRCAAPSGRPPALAAPGTRGPPRPHRSAAHRSAAHRIARLGAAHKMEAGAGGPRAGSPPRPACAAPSPARTA